MALQLQDIVRIDGLEGHPRAEELAHMVGYEGRITEINEEAQTATVRIFNGLNFSDIPLNQLSKSNEGPLMVYKEVHSTSYDRWLIGYRLDKSRRLRRIVAECWNEENALEVYKALRFHNQLVLAALQAKHAGNPPTEFVAQIGMAINEAVDVLAHLDEPVKIYTAMDEENWD